MARDSFNTPHGLTVDNCGRESENRGYRSRHNTIQTFTMDGEYKTTIEGFGLPANAEIYKDLMVIPEFGGTCFVAG